MVVTTVIFRRLCRGLAKRSLLVKNAAPFARFSPHALIVDDASFPGYIRPWAEREQQHRKFIFGALLFDDGRSCGGAGVDSGTTLSRSITSADIIENIPASRIVIICFNVCSVGVHDKKYNDIYVPGLGGTPLQSNSSCFGRLTVFDAIRKSENSQNVVTWRIRL